MNQTTNVFKQKLSTLHKEHETLLNDYILVLEEFPFPDHPAVSSFKTAIDEFKESIHQFSLIVNKLEK